MEKFKRIWFLVLLAVLCLPMMQTCFHLVDEGPLDGVAQNAKKPVVNRQTLYQETAQDSLMKWCTEQTGFRNTMIRVNNQLLFSVYGKVPNTGIVRGKDRYNYFGTRYVLSYTGQSFLGEDEIQKRTRRLKVAQDILLTKGVTVVPVFALGKASFYPELIPDRYLAKSRGTNNYNEFLKAFAEQGVGVIDFNRYFCDQKGTETYPYYSNLSTHWTVYAATLAMDSLVHYMESKTQKTHAHAVIERYDTTWLLPQDDEMSRNMNLIFPLEHQTLYQPEFSFTEGYKPKVVAISDSYWWTVFADKVFLPQTLFTNTGFWYYNNTIHYDKLHHSVSEIDMADELRSSDFVVLLYSATTQYRMNDNFSQQALEAFGVEEVALDSMDFVEREIQRAIRNLLASPNSMKSIREKAIKYNKTIEQAVHDDARWIVNNKIKNGKLKWEGKPADTIVLDSTAFVEREIQRTMKRLSADPKLKESVLEKAKKHNKTYEQALHDDAVWVVKRKIEKGTLTVPSTKDTNTKTEHHGIQ